MKPSTPFKMKIGASMKSVWWFSIVSFVLLAPMLRAQTPPTDGMRLWLKADTGVIADAKGNIARWTDQSGKGNDATQATAGSRPTLAANSLNGLPAVQFTASKNQWFALPNIMNGATAGEAFVVVQVASGSPSSPSSLWSLGSAGADYFPNIDGTIAESFGSNTQYNIGCPANGLGQYVLYNVSAQPGQWLAQIDGITVASSGGNAVAFGSTPTLGSDYWGDCFFDGDIAEIIVYENALTADQRAAVGAYLQGKYAIVPAPASPTSLTVTVISPTETSLVWSTASSLPWVTSTVWRQSGTGDFVAVAQVTNGLSYVDSGLAPGATYNYKISCNTLAGGSAGFSNQVGVATPATGTDMPLSGMCLWLRGDTGIIADPYGDINRWQDLSGNGNDATQTSAGSRPTLATNSLNGLSSVNFVGDIGQWFALPNIMNGASSGEAFVLVQVASNLPATARSLWNLGSSGADYFPNTDGTISESFGSTTQYNFGSPAYGLDQYVLYNVSAQAGQWFAQIDGATVASFGGNEVSFSSTPSLGCSDLNNPYYNRNYFDGNIAEVIVYGNTLTSEQRAAVNTYFQGKYSLASVPAAPRNLTATPVSSTTTWLVWSESPMISGTAYTVWRQSGASDFVAVAQVTSGLGFLDSGLMPGTSYNYEISASTLAGASSGFSNLVGVTTQTLANIPQAGINLWLRADLGVIADPNGSIRRWHDLSGNGNDATQPVAGSQPTLVTDPLIGLPAVQFAANTGQWFVLPNIMNGASAGEAFVVVKAASCSPSYPCSLWGLGSSFADYFPNTDGTISESFGSQTQYNLGCPAYGLNQYVLYNVSAQAGQWLAQIDGATVASFAGNSVFFNSTPNLGCSSGADNYCFDGDIAEIIVYGNTLTPNQRAAVDTYFQGKYNLWSQPPNPTNLVVTPISPTETSLAWAESSSVPGVTYTIWRQSGSGDFVVVAEAINGLSYVDSGLTPGASYNYEISANTLAGASQGFSNSASVTTQNSGGDVSLSGMCLWLQANTGVIADSNGNISRWRDLSGNGNDATQSTVSSQPTLVANSLNGLPVVQFAATNGQWLTLPNIMNGAAAGEVFVIVKAASAAPSGYPSLWSLGTGDSYPEYNGVIYEGFGSNSQYKIGSSVYGLDQYLLYNVSAQPGQWTAQIDGGTVASYTGNTVFFDNPPYLGCSGYWGGSNCFDGDVAEIIVYGNVLTPDQRAAVGTYFQGKYNLASMPPNPTNLTVSPVSGSEVYLAWSGFSEIPGITYTIWRQSDSGNFAAVAQVTGLGYLDRELIPGVNYSYEISANTLAGASPGFSNSVSVATQASEAGMPLDGMNLWLRADVGVAADSNGDISRWQDLSGNGNDATQSTVGSQPTLAANSINGLPAVHFSAAIGQWFILPNFMNGASAGEAFVVVKAASSLPSQSRGLWNLGSGWTWDTGSFPDTDGTISDNFGSQSEYKLGRPPYGLDQYLLYNVSAQTGLWFAQINGAPIASFLGNTVGFGTTPVLGCAGYDGYEGLVSPFDGSVAEVVIYSNTLSTEQRAAVDAYFQGRYNLAGIPAAPTNLTAVPVSATETWLVWSGSSTLPGITYTIWRQNGSGDFIAVAQVGNALSYVDTGLTPGTNYNYEISANTLAGSSPGFSNSVSVTTQPPGADIPVGGTNLWLRADVGVVADSNGNISRWQDLSGNGNDATQSIVGSQPTLAANSINGLPAVQFAASKRQWFTLPNIMNGASAGEAFVVVKAASKLPSSPRSLWSFGYSLYPDRDGSICEGFGSQTAYRFGGPGSGIDQYVLYNVSAQAGQWFAQIDGATVGKFAGNTVSFGGAPNLGALDSTGWDSFDGEIAEIIVYGTTFTVQQRAAMNAYFQGKYNLASVPPSPTNLTVTPISPTETSLAWSESPVVPGITYTIWRQSGSDDYIAIAQVANELSYLDTGLTPGTSYNYEISASTLVGSSPGSTSPVSVTTLNSMDIPLGGMNLWLRADVGVVADSDGNISRWQDLSGSGNDATQSTAGSQPTLVPNSLNGLPSVNFNPSKSEWFSLPDVLNGASAGEAFVVVKAVSDSPSWPRSLWGFGSSYPSNDGNIYENFGSNTQYNLGSPAFGIDQYLVYNVSAQPGQWLAQIDGATVASFGGNTVYFSSTPYLGCSSWAGGNCFDGNIAEIIVYGYALTPQERGEVDAYFQEKYDLATVPTNPTDLTVTVISSTATSLAWSESPVIPGVIYTVWRQNGSSDFVAIAQVDNGLSYVDSGLTPGTSYNYEISANTLAGSSPGFSNSVSATTLPASDIPYASMRLWLRADIGAIADSNGNISRWQDLSGNGNDATQSIVSRQPTLVANSLNGLPAVQFTANKDQSFTLPNVMSGANSGEVFVVAKAASNAPSYYRSLWSLGSGDYYPYFDGSVYEGFGSQTQYNLGRPSLNLDQYIVYNVSTRTGAWTARIDGVVLSDRTGNTVYFDPQPTLGGYGGYSFFDGDIAEVILFGNELSGTQREAVQASLAQRYNLGMESMSFSPVPGTYSGPISVTMTSTPTGTPIYYTTDGSAPDPSVSTLYSAPISITASTHFKAAMFADDGTAKLADGLYLIGTAEGSATPTSGFAAIYYQGAAFTGQTTTRLDPVIDFPVGSWNNYNWSCIPGNVGSALWTGTLTAQYTDTYTFSIASDGNPQLWVNGVLIIDGSAQTSRGIVFGSISLVAGQSYPIRLQYVVRNPSNSADELLSLTWSGVSFPQESIPTWQVSSGLSWPSSVSTPTAAPSSSTVLTGSIVTLTAAYPADADIYYTLDGTVPTSNSIIYTTPIVLNAAATITAIAYADGYNPSGLMVANYAVDSDGPTLSNPTFNGAAIPATITTDGIFAITAVDPLGVKSVLFNLDGQPLTTAAVGGNAYNAAFSVAGVPDGAHTLTIQATNYIGAASATVTVPFAVAIASPLPPNLTSPSSGTRTNQNSITVTGTTVGGDLVTLYNGAAVVGTATADSGGAFSFQAALLPGANVFSATAQNRNPQPSAPSATVTVTYDNTVPGIPAMLTAKAGAGGTVQLSWQPPVGGPATGYYLYRSTSAIPDGTAFPDSSALGGLLRGLSYNDTPPADGQYFYRMVTVYVVGSGETLSALSNQVNVVVNGTPPSATVVLQPLGSEVDSVHNRLGTGPVQVTVTVSKALSAVPFFNLSIGGVGVIPVNLTSAGNNVFTGVFSIVSTTPSGAITPVFTAIDAFGNKGYSATIAVPWVVDTHGPTATGLTPVQIQSGSVTNLPVVDAYQNSSANPITLSWRLTLDKATGGGVVPTSTAALSGHPGLSIPVTVVSGGDTANLTWLLTLTLPTDAGAQAENLVLAYSAADDLNNVGNTIVPPHSFQIYQGTLPPLGTPSGLTATALPAGTVQLTWNAIPGASSYILQVEGPGQTTFQNLANPNGSTTQYAYIPASDGIYSYEIASVRSENGQNVPSGFSTPVSATSDRVPPQAPTAFSLQVIPQGVGATWTAPVGNPGDIAGYALYRSSSSIASVSSLTPILPNIPGSYTSVVDPSPDATAPYYALVAFDAAGNFSVPVTGFADVGLLPVGVLQVTQADQSNPVLTWQKAPGSLIDNYSVLVNNNLVSVDGSTLLSVSDVSYVDTNYTGADTTYRVRAISGPASIDRSILLPNVSIVLASDAKVIRGLVNSVNVVVQNLSASPITNAQLDLRVANRDHEAPNLISLAPGAQQTVPIVVGGYSDVSAGATSVSAILSIAPNQGELVSVTRTSNVPVTEGAFTATVVASNLIRGGSGSVVFTLKNPSSEPIEFKVAQQNGTQPSSEARINITDQNGNLLSTTPLDLVLGDNVVMLPDGTTVVSIPAGATYTSPPISVPVPTSAPAQVNVVLGIDYVYYDWGVAGSQITLTGPSAVANGVSTQTAPYSGVITAINPSVSNGTAPITIKGQALWAAIDPTLPAALAPGVPVVVYVKLGNFIYQSPVTTDASGNFSYSYQPGATELGGVYSVWASNPSVTAAPANPSTFTITSLIVTPLQMNLNVPRNYTQALPLQVTTGPGTVVQNLRAELIGALPDAVSFTTTPIASIGQSQTASLPLSITGLAPTQTSLDSGELDFNVLSDLPGGGTQTWTTLRVSYQFSAAQPYLSATPSQVQIGLAPGTTASGTIDLKNIGLAALVNPVLSLVMADGSAVPNWIQLGTAGNLSSLDIGADFTVTVTAAPPASSLTIDQIYNLGLQVTAANGTQIFPITITVSPSGHGSAFFKIIDPYYQLVLPEGSTNPSFNGVPGASVVLANVTSTGIPTVSQAVTTDSNGEASFSTLPAGSYTLTITADQHESYTESVTIQPGVTYTQQVPLTYSPISFSWSVVPVTIQDNYQVVLTATFQTQVPVPVVVIEPSTITLPAMCAGQVYNGQMSVTNYGLIDAQNAQLVPPANDANYTYSFSSNFGTKIPAGKTVTIAYQITCVQSFAGDCPSSVAMSGPDKRATGGLAALSIGTAPSRTRNSLGVYTDGGGSGSSAGCGVYTTYTTINYGYPCAYGVDYSSTAVAAITHTWGTCPPGSGGTPTTWSTPGGVGIGHPPTWGSDPGGPGGGGTAAGSDLCYAQPQPNSGPCNMGSPNPNPNDSSSGDPTSCSTNGPGATCIPPSGSKTGSWVDLTKRQYRDRIVDLTIPVPNGNVSVWRDFNYNRWNFRINDDFYALTGGAQNPQVSALVIDGDYYLSPQTPNGLTLGNTIGVPQYVEGQVFMRLAVGPQKVTSSNGQYVWTDGQRNERDYTPTGKLVSAKYWGHLVSAYNYDDSGNLTTITNRDGTVVLTLGYSGANLSSVLDSTGRQVSYTYDSAGRLSTVTDAVGTVTTYAYDNWWDLTSKRTHLANTTADQDHVVTITYQLLNSAPTLATLPLRVVPGSPFFGEVVHAMVTDVSDNTGYDTSFVYQYNSAKQTYYAKETTKNGVVTELVFDQSSNLLSKVVNGQQVYAMQQTASTYAVTRGTDLTTEEYDSMGNLVRRIYPDLSVEHYEYDPVTNKVAKYTDPLVAVTTYVYDNLGNELTRDEAVGTPVERVTTSEYYPGTNLLKLRTDPLRNQIAYTYDSSDNLLRSYDPANPSHQTTYTYDSLGHVLTMTDALGNVTSYTYDALGQVLTVTDPLQEQTINTYQGNLLVQQETGRTAVASGRIARYTYDVAGHRTAEQRVDSLGKATTVKTMAYDPDGKLVSVTNALSQAVTFGYDAFDNRNLVSKPADDGTRSQTQATYDALGHETQDVDPLGVVTNKTYDSRDRITTIIEAAGTSVQRTTTYQYDSLGHVLKEVHTDVLNPGLTYTTIKAYDALGRLASVGGNHVYPETYAYDADDNRLTKTDALSRVTSYDYDAYGSLLDVKIDGVQVAAFAYDLVGNRISETDGVGNHRHIGCDALNRVAATSIPMPATQAVPTNWWTQPSSVLQSTSYTAWGKVASTTLYTANGSSVQQATTQYAYDGFGRKTGDTDPAGLTRTYAYDAADDLLSVTYPAIASSGSALPTVETYMRSPNNGALVDTFVDRAGNATAYGYDGALRPVRVTNSLSGVTVNTFDPLGRVASQTDPANNTTQSAYDLFDHPVQMTYPDNIAGTQPRVATYTYDNFGKLLTQTGAGDYPLTFGYDAVGNLISLTDANGHTTSWSYTDRNQVQTKTSADTTACTYTYDAAGHLQTRLDQLGHTTTYGYNAYNLVSSVNYPTDAQVAFTYDQQGRRLTMTDGSGTTTWTYDAAGRTASETQARSNRIVNYSYDSFSNRTGLLVQSTDGSEPDWNTAYGYDNASRLGSILDARLPSSQPYVYSYNGNANLVFKITSPSGLTTLKTYDNLGRLLSISAQGSNNSPINSFTYAYDSVGQRTTETALDHQRSFSYDAQRQLIQATTTANGVQTAMPQYTYDGIGNRLTSAVNDSNGAQSSAYTPNLVNQYTAITGTLADAPAYDANGNTTTVAGETLSYDEENRLVEIADATHQSVFIYDGLGRRVERQEYAGGSQTAVIHHVYDGRNVIEDLGSSYTAIRSYTRGLDLSGSFAGAGGIGGLLAFSQISNAQILNSASYFYDGNGNVTDLVSDNGTSAAHYVYSPFGYRVSATGALADVNPYQFSSKERDLATGFYYYGLRYYDPAKGRWLSRDPIGERGGVNMYGFVYNSPVDIFDSTGREPSKPIGTMQQLFPDQTAKMDPLKDQLLQGTPTVPGSPIPPDMSNPTRRNSGAPAGTGAGAAAGGIAQLVNDIVSFTDKLDRNRAWAKQGMLLNAFPKICDQLKSLLGNSKGSCGCCTLVTVMTMSSSGYISGGLLSPKEFVAPSGDAVRIDYADITYVSTPCSQTTAGKDYPSFLIDPMYQVRTVDQIQR